MACQTAVRDSNSGNFGCSQQWLYTTKYQLYQLFKDLNALLLAGMAKGGGYSKTPPPP